MVNTDCLIIPTAQGLLDCFNLRTNTYKDKSICYLLSQEKINVHLIILVFSFIFHNCNRESSLYEIKYSDLRTYRGHSNSSNGFNLKQELLNLENIMCFWDDKQIGELADITMDGRNVLINSEYFFRLYKVIEKTTRLNHKAAFTNIINKSIVLQRSHSATEIVVEICKLVERRGKLNDGETAHIAVETLINRCPNLKYKVNNASSKSRINQILRIDILKAIELLELHTRIYKVFNDFEIILPERFSVNKQQKIELVHSGRNYL